MIALVTVPEDNKSFWRLAARVIGGTLVFSVTVLIVFALFIIGSAAVGFMVRAFRWAAGL